VTPLNAAIASANVGGTTKVAQGCAINSQDKSGFAAAVTLAQVCVECEAHHSAALFRVRLPLCNTHLLSCPFQASDVVILALGIDGSIEGPPEGLLLSCRAPFLSLTLTCSLHAGESEDRTSIALPGVQDDLAAAVAAAGKPIVLLVVNGGA
jgi:hypothetical protein